MDRCRKFLSHHTLVSQKVQKVRPSSLTEQYWRQVKFLAIHLVLAQRLAFHLDTQSLKLALHPICHLEAVRASFRVTGHGGDWAVCRISNTALHSVRQQLAGYCIRQSLNQSFLVGRDIFLPA